MTRPRLLDLFCGAGGASMGYHRAGFDVVGVDINPQPNYPFEFHQGDALDLAPEAPGCYDAIHASPPCQRYSRATKRHGSTDIHPDLVDVVRELLVSTGTLYVIENVEGAPLVDPLTLCGSMFPDTMRLRRHRLFETNFPVPRLTCNHKAQGLIVGVYGNPGGSSVRDGLKFGSTAQWREAMDINWMPARSLSQSIPPRYSQYIGTELIKHLSATKRETQ